MGRRKTKNKTKGASLKSALLGILIGVVFGIIAAVAGIRVGGNIQGELTDTQELFVIEGMLLFFFVSYLLQIFIHEAGHLIFGLLSGYKFISYRVFSFTLIKKDGKFQWKRFSIPGTAGQCLLDPPKKNEDGNFPNILYNLGGTLANFITVAIVYVLAAAFRNEMIQNFALIFAICGLLLGFTNGIPMKISGIANDGYNIYSLRKDKLAANAFYQQLYVNAQSSKGIVYRELPKEEVFLEEVTDYSNPLLAAAKLNEYNWYMDQLDYEEGSKILETLGKEKASYIGLIRNMINLETIYLTLTTTKDTQVIQECDTKELRIYMKKAKYDCAVKRVQYVQALSEGKQEEADKAWKQLNVLVQKTPVAGEGEFNLRLAKDARRRIEEMQSEEKQSENLDLNS